ncbi:MAG: type II toxin-antitoxin system RelE/ParE family toxin [Brevundimonas sp.]
MKVVFSPGSERDLEQIADHIAQDSPRRALSFVRELRAAAQALALDPESRPRANFDPRIRRSVHGAYNLYYAVLPGELRFLAIIHGSRADDAVLFDLVKR